MSLLIRRARPGEAGLVLSFVRELAEYEKLLHEMEATEADIDAAVGRIEQHLMKWQLRSGVTEKL